MIRPATILAVAGVVASLALPGRGSAQVVRSFTPPARGNDQKNDIPREYKPPRGMCRIWIDGVPARQQPAPTDCPTAVRNKPRNGRVIWGEEASGNDRKDRDPKKPKKPEGERDSQA
jgi:hypothetical protein